MKVLGIHILKDHTLQILLESARNNAFNEVAYQKVLNEKHDLAPCGERLPNEKRPAFANPLLLASPVAIEPTTH
ncbi:MAG: hypothetical protein ACYDAA_00445 [Syntrophales bacterium]